MSDKYEDTCPLDAGYLWAGNETPPPIDESIVRGILSESNKPNTFNNLGQIFYKYHSNTVGKIEDRALYIKTNLSCSKTDKYAWAVVYVFHISDNKTEVIITDWIYMSDFKKNKVNEFLQKYGYYQATYDKAKDTISLFNIDIDKYNEHEA